MADFDIFALPVGGGTLALCPLPAGHMDEVQAWGPDLVISVIEAHEMAADLWSGFAHRHVPVVDYGVPVGTAWDVAEDEALTVLRQGGRVLVHCKGGCGRSGMAVLRLMEKAGERGALTRLRAVRACAVETADQLAWAEGRAE